MVERAEKIYQALTKAGLSEGEINHKIREKLTEFQGFMTKQAALFLIAKEYGINIYSSEYNNDIQKEFEELIDYNDFAIEISNISEEMRNIVITGRITEIFGIRKFFRKDDTVGIVGSFQICDKSECIKVIIWNEQVRIMENDFFKKGEIIQVIGGYSKKGIDNKLEVHLSRQGKVILAPKGVTLPEVNKIDYQKLSKKNVAKTHLKFTIKELHNKEGFIKFVKGAVYVEEFKELILKNGEKSFLLKIILSDESGSIKVNIWGMDAVKYLKVIDEGDIIKLINVIIKENKYSNEKELNFIKNSKLVKKKK